MSFDATAASSALDYLRREALVHDVLTHLRGQSLAPDTPPGRYNFLWSAIEPELGETTSFDEWQLDSDSVHEAWCRTCEQHARTLTFWRGLAIVLREWALETEEAEGGGWEAAGEYWRLSTGIMRHLLCCEEFWELTFRTGEGIDREQLPDVRHEIYEQIITEHLDRANIYRQTNAEAACLHAGCLRALAHLDLEEPQEDTGVTPRLPASDELAQEVKKTFGSALDNWASDWIFRSEQMLLEPDRVARQPPGIKKAYPDAIAHTMQFLDLVPDNARAALYVTRQYSRYAEDALVVDRDGLFEEVVEQSEAAARFLEPLTPRRQGGAPANVALCERLVYRALTDCSADEKIDYLLEALEWNPDDRDATRLLERAKDLSISEELKKINDLVEQECYEEAEEKLDELETEVGETLAPINLLRARILFQQAHAAGEDYRFEEASATMARARELAPEEEVVAEHAEMFADLAEEADEYRAFFTARDRHEDGQAVEAMRLSETIPPDFSGYYRVRRLRAACCFEEAVRLANEYEQFEAAMVLMDTAVELDPRESFLQGQRDTLRANAVASFFARARDAAEAGEYELAASLLRRAARYADGDEKSVLLDHAREMAQRATESPYIAALEEAHSHMENEEFSEAVPLLEGIPASFSDYHLVRHLIWQAYLGAAVENDARGNRAEARRLAEMALDYVDEENRTMAEQIAARFGAFR